MTPSRIYLTIEVNFHHQIFLNLLNTKFNSFDEGREGIPFVPSENGRKILIVMNGNDAGSYIGWRTISKNGQVERFINIEEFKQDNHHNKTSRLSCTTEVGEIDYKGRNHHKYLHRLLKNGRVHMIFPK